MKFIPLINLRNFVRQRRCSGTNAVPQPSCNNSKAGKLCLARREADEGGSADRNLNINLNIDPLIINLGEMFESENY